MEKTLEPWATWESCEDEGVRDALTRMASQAPQFFADSSLTSARCARLPFYSRHRLIELTFVRDHGPERAFVLDDGSEARWLDGTSTAMHDTNAAESLALTDPTVQDYVRYFLYFLRSDEGAFTLIESPAEVQAAGHDDAWFDQYRDQLDLDVAQLWMRLQTVRGQVTPLRIEKRDDDGRWVVSGRVAYAGSLSKVNFAVSSGGLVEMIDDEPIEVLTALAVPECPTLELTANLDALEEPDEEEEPPPAKTAPDRTEFIRRIVERETDVPRDREVTQAVVATLLEEAIRKRETNTLLRHFNSETAADRPIERLSQVVSRSVPIIVIESDIPFVEDFVAGLIDGPNEAVTGGLIARAGAYNGDDLRCTAVLQNDRIKLHLISFHAYRSLFDAERVAHELSIRDTAVLIGCDRMSDVPEPLRRVTDLVLTFPQIDRRVFARIFERVFETKPTPGWDAPGADWTRYLVPADFHAPRRLGLTPDHSLAFLKERVEARLKQVTPDFGPALTDLHGLGEARHICEDLIADIRAAQSGQIPWTGVDKGLLLVGPPGTGKTTLARAIARECGIKFVAASAARWQSAGALDAHLRAMRSDFVEAHRYAPSILFLDEIDSIGNREQLTGPVTQYQTEVINALLEQIQGINTADPVIVIGATNYFDKVDPALRRAGRLDQMVQIPLPNIASLQQIFGYYLRTHRAETQVAADINERALAELAFGLTGADVEFFVRGASRRARREGRPIGHADLVAEVTRRPRRADSAPFVGPDEIRRTAVHEAGHALARLMSSTKGEDITFVTIIPRLDGTLGFVASVPLDGHVLTRRTMLEQLETALAGRAAEEVVYGADNVGLGAGGSSTSSDLAIATRLATLLVCQTGLGEDGGLQWTEAATPAQVAQIDALLRRAYSSIVARLQSHRPQFDRIVEWLVERQELSGADLRHLIGARRAADAATA